MGKKKYKLAILNNGSPEDHEPWLKACKKYSEYISYDVINLLGHDWFERIMEHQYDYLLAKPPGLTAIYKQIYDERICIFQYFHLFLHP